MNFYFVGSNCNSASSWEYSDKLAMNSFNIDFPKKVSCGLEVIRSYFKMYKIVGIFE